MRDNRKSLLLQNLSKKHDIKSVGLLQALIKRLEYRSMAHVYEDYGIGSVDEFEDFIKSAIGPLSNYEINTVNALRDEYEKPSRL